jgi:hypothetical protein
MQNRCQTPSLKKGNVSPKGRFSGKKNGLGASAKEVAEGVSAEEAVERLDIPARTAIRMTARRRAARFFMGL